MCPFTLLVQPAKSGMLRQPKHLTKASFVCPYEKWSSDDHCSMMSDECLFSAPASAPARSQNGKGVAPA